MIYVTGDTQGLSSVDKLNNAYYIKKEDYLIVAGDFGVCWDNNINDALTVNYPPLNLTVRSGGLHKASPVD